MESVRGPELPGLLLRAERDALIPLLRSRPDEDFAIRTCCPGWTVRHVLAHCGAALTRVVEGRLADGAFTSESNDLDIAERADWSNARIVDELERGMTEAGPVIAAAHPERGGHSDLGGIALGEWVHAGDVREALGEPGAYEAGEALDLALDLFAALTGARGTAPLLAAVDGRSAPLALGLRTDGGPEPARYRGSAGTLVRLLAARPLTGTRYELTGAREADLHFFR
ncbi:maleylpyruvate isomerase family mycothiol-dependent enzyme [Streptomyces amakusaensis]|uniref:Maleylpyruvate isomerase family mycothiol-dependent enzyme n=1 Tax=Streptomyces amakusaensis TaxID=67271 RepID=A0ABW0AJ19_9ACTN